MPLQRLARLLQHFLRITRSTRNNHFPLAHPPVSAPDDNVEHDTAKATAGPPRLPGGHAGMRDTYGRVGDLRLLEQQTAMDVGRRIDLLRLVVLGGAGEERRKRGGREWFVD